VIEALNYLMHIEEQGRTKAGDPPLGIVTKGWRRYVSVGDGFDHKHMSSVALIGFDPHSAAVTFSSRPAYGMPTRGQGF
jgi:hypothetical protein